jgi:CheY-like chemotaxis protein
MISTPRVEDDHAAGPGPAAAADPRLGETMTTDRRIHPRFPLILAVQHLGAEGALGYTENLSAGGIFIRTEREFQVGERVQLVVSFPQLLAPIELTVEVMRRDEGGDAPSGVAVVVPPDRADDLQKLGEIARQMADAARAPVPDVRILVAEDNKLLATMYEEAIHKLSGKGAPGLGIEVVRDGHEAFARLLRPPPIDLLVTDVHMPGLDGVALVEKLRAEPSLAALPVVAISSAGAAEQAALARLGVSLFLHKPVRLAELASTIRFLLKGKTPQPPEGAVPHGASGGGPLTN